MVVSLIEGRIRIRHEQLREEPALAKLRQSLANLPGILALIVNERAGSILIRHDRAISASEILKAVPADLVRDQAPASVKGAAGKVAEGKTPEAAGNRCAAIRRRATNLGMLASLLLSLGAAAFGAKRLHVLSGAVYVAANGLHLFDKRRTLLR